jgi:Cu/Ag efflux protein CusF
MNFVANPYRMLRASILASALIGAGLTLQMGEALAQGGMSDMKKMPGMNDMKMSDTKKATTANATGTWPAMNMEFAVASSVDLAKLKTGDKVNFTLSGSGGTYTVQSIGASP